MRKKHSSAYWAFSLAIALGNALIEREATAQTQFNLSAGAWVPVLPDYNAALRGVDANPPGPHASIFADDQTDVGAQLTIAGFYHFAPTRTLFESDLQIAGIGSMGSSAVFDDPGVGETIWFPSLDGNTSLTTADGESVAMNLDSDLFHVHKYTGLRDRFSLNWLGLGDITIGCGFSWMLFDQDFQADAQFGDGRRGQYIEDLDTNFLGGEFRGTLRQSIFGHTCYFDARYGIYEMDAEYYGVSTAHDAGGTLTNETHFSTGLTKTTSTVDLAVRTDLYVGGWLVRPTIGFKYFDDMAQIDHPTGIGSGGTSISTDNAYIFNGSLEFSF